jgi:hypothetical protein
MRKPEDYYDDTERNIEKIESAWAKAALYFRTEQHFGHPVGSERTRGLLTIREQLDVYKTRFESGQDTMALLHAVSVCAEENLPLPTWLATKYREAFHSFLAVNGKTSLDEIFYSPRLPTDTAKKTALARQDWALGAEIWRALWNVSMADISITSLDRAVTEVLKIHKFGVGKTKAKSLYLMVEKNQLELLGKGQTLSRYLEKRRKL